MEIIRSLKWLLGYIGYDETLNDDDLTKCLIQEAAKWMCLFNNTTCQKNAKNKLNDQLENPEENK